MQDEQMTAERETTKKSAMMDGRRWYGMDVEGESGGRVHGVR